MSKRGIWRHRIFKIFLTRGIFKSIFKPLLYSKEDHIHLDFVNVMVPLTENIDLNNKFGMTYMLWLYKAPKEIFEELFLKDEQNDQYFLATVNSDLKNGALCAHYCQAFSMWYLEQFLANDINFRTKIDLNMSDFESLLNHSYGIMNMTLVYLKLFREKFDLNKMDVDPRDWSIHYVYGIHDLLIKDQSVLENTLSTWDNNVIEKTEFIARMTQYFVSHKEYNLSLK